MSLSSLAARGRRFAGFAAGAGLKAAELYAANTLGVSLIGLGSWALLLQARPPSRRCDH